MPILGTCPCCRATDTIAAYLADAETRAAWALLASRLAHHPALLTRCLPYLDLHAPQSHAMHLPKLRRLLGELADLVTTGPPPAVWALAMDAALEARQHGTLHLPLPDGFGWLKSVAAAKAQDPAALAAARQLGAGASRPGVSTDAAPSAVDLMAELQADLRHWAALVARGHGGPGGTGVLEKLRARYLTLTGRDWEPAP